MHFEKFIKFSPKHQLPGFFNLENVVENFNDSLMTGNLVEMTFFRLIIVVIGEKVDGFCLIWGIYARFAKKMAESSQLILSLILFEG